MITAQEALHRMQVADPVPTLDAVPDDLVASVWASVDAHLDAATGTRLPAATVRGVGRAESWRRPAFVVALVFAVTVAVVGAVALVRTDEAAVTTIVATTVPAPTVPPTTGPVAPPTTTPPATTTTTLPERPASLEISWARIPEQSELEDGWISAATPGGPGYVAVGGTVGCSDPVSPNCRLDAAVWVSPDGVTWERIESESFRGEAAREVSHGEPLDGDQYMSDVAVGPAGLVAVGAAPIIDPDRPVGYLDRVGIWLSPDGREWERVPHDEEVFGGFEELKRIVTLGDRLIAVGGSRALLSDDGETWEAVVIDPSPTAEVLDLTVWNGGLVAVGSVDDRPAVWVSEDGLTWTSIDDPDLEAVAGNLQGVGGNAEGLVALGTGFPTARVTTWRSADGIEWTTTSKWLGDDQVWQDTARTGVAVDRGTGGIEDDVVLINGASTLWGTVDGGERWHSVGVFDGGLLEVLASSAPSVFNTVNQVLVVEDRLLAFGKVVAWSGTEPIGGLCYVDPGDGSLGSCRADAAIWVGTWEGAP